MKRLTCNINTVVTIVAVAIFSLSCTGSFEDKNIKHEDAVDVPLTDLLGGYLLQMQRHIIPTSTNAYQQAESLAGQVYGRYFYYGYSEKANFKQNYAKFDAPDNWLDNPFRTVMTNTYTPWFSIADLTEKTGTFYYWAQLIRVAAMQRLVDMYGPLPYSKVAEGTGGFFVAYDSTEDAYKNMMTDLTEAINRLYAQATADPGNRVMKDYDHVYGGDFAMWVRFGNSLKLRMAMRMSYADENYAKERIKEVLAHAGGHIENNSHNAFITENPNPLHGGVGYKDILAAAEIVTYLTGYKDPRAGKYLTASSLTNPASYQGIKVGVPTNDSWSQGYSLPVVSESDPLMIMNAAEISFLKAEAALRWSDMNMGGTAQDLYEQGVKLSFDQWGVKADDATAYLKDDTSTQADFLDAGGNSDGDNMSTPKVSTITIKWDSSADTETNLERIITQKWLALYPLGNEAWSEFRRTGYPRFFDIPNTTNGDASLRTHGASRVPFSPQEKLDNTANYNAAVNLLGGKDEYGVRLWWDAKNPKAGW